MTRGDVEQGFKDADHVIEGEINCAGQDHWCVRLRSFFRFSSHRGVLHATGREKAKKNSLITVRVHFLPTAYRAGTLYTRVAHSLSIERVHFRPQPEHREDAYTHDTQS